MPLNASIVGASTQPVEHHLDARWLMAYAASLGDLNPRYMDTASPGTNEGVVVGHPVFPVCVEWPVILNTREIAGSQSLTSEESARGVHAAHDLHIYRPFRDGERVSTTGTMIGVRKIKPGAAYTMRLDTVNADSNELIARTYQLGIYRGVEVLGEDTQSEEVPALPELSGLENAGTTSIHVPAGAAHTYTECAHIWNPIHTDRAVALAAGLPDIILHGTATLALAVSRIVDQFADGDPSKVRRLGGRFAAMVLMPSTISLRAESRNCEEGNIISYQVLTEDGQTAISGGFVQLDD